MPHQRKYVPSHSGGTESQPSRAKRSISACASQGFNSRLSRSTRCAFVSFTASLIGPSRNAKARGRVRFSARPPAGCLWLRRRLAEGYVIRGIAGGASNDALHRAHLDPDRPCISGVIPLLGWKSTHCRSRLSRGASSVGLKRLCSPLEGPAVVITFPSRPDDGAQGGPTWRRAFTTIHTRGR